MEVTERPRASSRVPRSYSLHEETHVELGRRAAELGISASEAAERAVQLWLRASGQRVLLARIEDMIAEAEGGGGPQ